MGERKKLVGSERISNKQLVKERGGEGKDVFVRRFLEDVKKVVGLEEKRVKFSFVKLRMFKVEVRFDVFLY